MVSSRLVKTILVASLIFITACATQPEEIVMTVIVEVTSTPKPTEEPTVPPTQTPYPTKTPTPTPEPWDVYVQEVAIHYDIFWGLLEEAAYRFLSHFNNPSPIHLQDLQEDYQVANVHLRRAVDVQVTCTQCEELNTKLRELLTVQEWIAVNTFPGDERTPSEFEQHSTRFGILTDEVEQMMLQGE